MKSAKQNTIVYVRALIDTELLSSSQNNDSLLFTSTKQRTRHADDGYKKNRPREASATD